MDTDNLFEKPSKCSMEDKLRAENLQLKLQNVQLQLQVMQSDLQRAMQSRNVLVGEMNKLRAEFHETYGVDLALVQIGEDGSFIQAPNNQALPR